MGEKDCKACETFKSLLKKRDEEIENLQTKIETLTNALKNYEVVQPVDNICIPSQQVGGTSSSNIGCQTVETSMNIRSDFLKAQLGTSFKKVLEDKQDNLDIHEQIEDLNANEHYAYDENMKMYFCESTGYYYDTESKLFYQPETKAYYRYNYSECQYELCEVENKVTNNQANDVTDVIKDVKEKQEKTSAYNTDAKTSTIEFDSLSSQFGSLNTGVKLVEGNIASVSQLASEKNDSSSLSGYIYNENIHMYYCESTGYYYEPVRKLYYHPETKSCYKFNSSLNKYDLVDDEDKENMLKLMCKIEQSNSKLCFQDDDSKLIETCSDTDYPDIRSPPTPNYNNCDDLEEEVIAKELEPCDLVKDWQVQEGSGVSIKDLVTEAVEESTAMSDYTWDEKSGMYYSVSTGYYYDSKRGLLYDPVEKIYYRYLPETSTYEFFYKVNDRLNERYVSSPNKDKKDKSNADTNTYEVSSPESGEIFSSDSETEAASSIHSAKEDGSCTSARSQISYDPISIYLFGNGKTRPVDPPCIRAIIEASSKLEIGSLILFTCSGALIGRDSSNAVCFPDTSVSKVHAKLTFDKESWSYSLEDLGSQNGTFVNDSRLSKPKMKSKPQALKHGDFLTFGSCKMRIHIHEGHETCDKCEPGQVMAKIAVKEAKVEVVFKSKEQREQERKQECNRLKKKYGLKGAEYVERNRPAATLTPGYEDRAEIRRKTVGSENPYEKTEAASTDVAMPDSNKGFQMLKKLGWKEGEALGLTKTGISEPIPFKSWSSRAGLGCTAAGSCGPILATDKKTKRWLKAQERYFQLSM